MRIVPIILAGGFGTRLWPASRAALPKQFADLGIGGGSLFQKTLERLAGLSGHVAEPIVVGNDRHRFLALEQAAGVGWQLGAMLLEPSGRNTAAAIAAAARYLENAGEAADSRLVVLPSDHVISDHAAFASALREAAAYDGGLVALGVVPTGPNTDFGYICPEDPATFGAAVPIRAFEEKPSRERAEALIAEGALWNAGIFVGTLSAFRREFETYAGDIWAGAAASVDEALRDLAFLRLDAGAWEGIPAAPFDRAVMEKTKNAVVVPLDAGWSDLGTWDAIWRHLRGDSTDNVVRGEAVVCEDASGNLVLSDGAAVGVSGLYDCVVIVRDDAVLVARRDAAGQVGSVVDALAALGHAAARDFPEDHRPWGSFRQLAKGTRYQVKRLVVKPGEALSAQMHHHRAEHWVVVSGTAAVEVDGRELLLSENESVYIPIGARHRLSNPGKVALEVIEVQSGGYLAEDDIIRFEDRYGRPDQESD